MVVTDFEFEVLYGERRPSRHEAILIVEGSEDIPSKSRVAIGKDVLKAEYWRRAKYAVITSSRT